MAQRGGGASARPAGRRGSRPSDRGEQRVDPARRSGGDLRALRTRLHGVIEPIVLAAGFDLDALTLSQAGRRLVVRVVIDSDGGVGLDELSQVSRLVSAGLDAAEEEAGEFRDVAGDADHRGALESYLLEVSSPGVDRPLTSPRHWRRNIGRLVKVSAAERTLTARVVTVNDVSVTLDCDGRVETFTLAELGPGRVQVEFAHLDDLADEDFGDELDSVEDGDELDSVEDGDELDGDELDSDELDGDEIDDEQADHGQAGIVQPIQEREDGA